MASRKPMKHGARPSKEEISLLEHLQRVMEEEISLSKHFERASLGKFPASLDVWSGRKDKVCPFEPVGSALEGKIPTHLPIGRPAKRGEFRPWQELPIDIVLVRPRNALDLSELSGIAAPVDLTALLGY